MTSHSEKRITWSPLGQNRFVVGRGSQITLYDWSPEDSSTHSVASQQCSQHIKCFAWSPDPTVDDLIAVGFGSGRVDLLRLESTRRLRASGTTPSRVGYAPLSPKVPRACTSLAFCGVTPWYLAVGLDRSRNDPSLMIWDVHSNSPTNVLTPAAPSPTHIVAPPPSPARPLTALPPSPRPQNPIPRTELGSRVDPRLLQTHAPNEFVHSLSWLPQHNNLLVAGLSNRLIRLFDLRSTAPAVAHTQGRVYAMSSDPFEPHFLAAAGDGVVTLWDVRKLPTPLLVFSERDALADGNRIQSSVVRRVTDLEFSSVRRGVLATLSQDTSYVRLWNVIKTEPLDAPPTIHASDATRTPKMSWSNATSMLPWSASGGTISVTPENAQPSPNASYSLVLSDTRKCRPANIHDTPIHVQWSARGNMAIAVGSAYRIFSSVRPGEVIPEPWSIQPTVVSQGIDDTGFGHFPIELSRGRSPSMHPPTFGRGDEDGFPALTSAGPSPKPSPRFQTSPLPASRSKEGTVSPTQRSFPASPYLKGNVELPSTSSPGPASLAPPSPASGSRHVAGTLKQSESNTSSRSRNASGRPWRRAIERTQTLVDADISMIMRRRVIAGYGLSHGARGDVVLGRSYVRGGVRWPRVYRILADARRMLEGPAIRLNGYNFANQGILGIWEGFDSSIPEAAPSNSFLLDPLVVEGISSMSRTQSRRGKHSVVVPSDFTAALLLLSASAYHKTDAATLESTEWKPTVSTAKLVQRRFALQLCGWSLKNEDISAVINKWEKDGRQSQAACWLVFLGRHNKAIDILMRSKHSSHNIMSGTLATLMPASARTPEVRHQFERLIMRLEDPYFRAMLTHLALGDWGDVLEEEHIPLRERLAIALQFLEDDALSAYLRRVAEASVAHGDVEGIIVTGLTASGMQLLQNHTAAILGANVHPHQLRDVRVDRWLDAYRDLLDGWKLFHHRCQLDVDRGQMLRDFTQGEGAGAGRRPRTDPARSTPDPDPVQLLQRGDQRAEGRQRGEQGE
ncbi:hypothetical protein F5148DRAFT_1276009 [Russula earlei]|uniref:Uncharacterized protein n=1 Tax=Russula earlei TaxID=71964 RepID=A0ACC0U897_9AGAM|nr:hypothetical protein F5148DRAFT_1276009 [Russula earlei]